jgi:hypothetical protein
LGYILFKKLRSFEILYISFTAQAAIGGFEFLSFQFGPTPPLAGE